MLDFAPSVEQVAGSMQITIYTDGACDIHAENRPGGWAAILRAEADGALLKETVLSGGAEQTTNNQMELRAVIEGLGALKEASKITVVTDSRYVEGIATGAMNAKSNKDLWRRYFETAERHDIAWKRVAGHSGDVLNERCDRLAVKEKRARSMDAAQADGEQASAEKTDAAIYLSTAIRPTKRACAFAAQVVCGKNAVAVSDVLTSGSELECALVGAIRSIESLPQSDSATVYTAQETLAKGMNSWLPKWKRNGWKTNSGQPVKHQRHWKRLLELSNGRVLYFQYMRDRKANPYFELGKTVAARLLESGA